MIRTTTLLSLLLTTLCWTMPGRTKANDQPPNIIFLFAMTGMG